MHVNKGNPLWQGCEGEAFAWVFLLNKDIYYECFAPIYPLTKV